MLVLVHDEDLGQQGELLAADFHASPRDNYSNSALVEVPLPLLICIDQAQTERIDQVLPQEVAAHSLVQLLTFWGTQL